MASLTMEPADWDNLREILRRVPEEKRDQRWMKAFETVERVKEKVRLEASQWAALRRILSEVGPRGGDKDRKWVEAFDSVNHVCEHILDLRDMVKDPRPLEEEGEHDGEGKNYP